MLLIKQISDSLINHPDDWEYISSYCNNRLVNKTLGVKIHAESRGLIGAWVHGLQEPTVNLGLICSYRLSRAVKHWFKHADVSRYN